MHLPMFHLSLLPLPGELVPLHIFEPRYQELLQDAETLDIRFGIYCHHELNKQKLGSLMKLESVLKRYHSGEADIIVRCIDIFTTEKLLRVYKNKTYPGGSVQCWDVDVEELPAIKLYQLFLTYLSKRNITKHSIAFNLYQVATELNLDLYDRYTFLTLSPEKRTHFLANQLKFQLHLLDQEDNNKDRYHLN